MPSKIRNSQFVFVTRKLAEIYDQLRRIRPRRSLSGELNAIGRRETANIAGSQRR